MAQDFYDYLWDTQGDNADQNSGIVGDVVDMAQAGLYQSVGGIADFVGADGIAQAAYNRADMQYETLTPEMRASMQKQIFVDNDDALFGFSVGDADWRTVVGNLGNVAGQMAIPIPGGALVGGATKVALKGIQAARAAKIASGASTAAIGALNAMSAGGQGGNDIRQQVLSTDFEQLSQIPEFKEMARAVYQQNPDASAMDILAGAREQLAEVAARSRMNDPTSFAANAALGAIGDKYILNAMTKGTAAKTMLGAAGRGAAMEGVTEAPQEALDTYATNRTAQQYVDPSIDLTANVPSSAATGALLGGVMGGGVAGIAQPFHKSATNVAPQQDSNQSPEETGQQPGQVDLTEEVELTDEPIVANPADESATFVSPEPAPVSPETLDVSATEHLDEPLFAPEPVNDQNTNDVLVDVSATEGLGQEGQTLDEAPTSNHEKDTLASEPAPSEPGSETSATKVTQEEPTSALEQPADDAPKVTYDPEITIPELKGQGWKYVGSWSDTNGLDSIVEKWGERAKKDNKEYKILGGENTRFGFHYGVVSRELTPSSDAMAKESDAMAMTPEPVSDKEADSATNVAQDKGSSFDAEKKLDELMAKLGNEKDKEERDRLVEILSQALGTAKSVRKGEGVKGRELRLRSRYREYKALQSLTKEDLLKLGRKGLKEKLTALGLGAYRNKGQAADAILNFRDQAPASISALKAAGDKMVSVAKLQKEGKPVPLEMLKDAGLSSEKTLYSKGDVIVANALGHKEVNPRGQRGRDEADYDHAEAVLTDPETAIKQLYDHDKPTTLQWLIPALQTQTGMITGSRNETAEAVEKFHRILPAVARELRSSVANDPELKAKVMSLADITEEQIMADRTSPAKPPRYKIKNIRGDGKHFRGLEIHDLESGESIDKLKEDGQEWLEFSPPIISEVERLNQALKLASSPLLSNHPDVAKSLKEIGEQGLASFKTTEESATDVAHTEDDKAPESATKETPKAQLPATGFGFANEAAAAIAKVKAREAEGKPIGEFGYFNALAREAGLSPSKMAEWLGWRSKRDGGFTTADEFKRRVQYVLKTEGAKGDSDITSYLFPSALHKRHGKKDIKKMARAKAQSKRDMAASQARTEAMRREAAAEAKEQMAREEARNAKDIAEAKAEAEALEAEVKRRSEKQASAGATLKAGDIIHNPEIGAEFEIDRIDKDGNAHGTNLDWDVSGVFTAGELKAMGYNVEPTKPKVENSRQITQWTNLDDPITSGPQAFDVFRHNNPDLTDDINVSRVAILERFNKVIGQIDGAGEAIRHLVGSDALKTALNIRSLRHFVQDHLAKESATNVAQEAVHIDKGEVEPATEPEIEESLYTAVASNNGVADTKEVVEALKEPIEQAIEKAKAHKNAAEIARLVKSQAHFNQVIGKLQADKKKKGADKTQIEHDLKAAREELDRAKAALDKQGGYVTFDVKGDGKFKVVNTPEAIQTFWDKLKKVGNGSGLQNPNRLPPSDNRSKREKVEQFLRSGEYENAKQMADALGLDKTLWKEFKPVDVYVEYKPYEDSDPLYYTPVVVAAGSSRPRPRIMGEAVRLVAKNVPYYRYIEEYDKQIPKKKTGKYSVTAEEFGALISGDANSATKVAHKPKPSKGKKPLSSGSTFKTQQGDYKVEDVVLGDYVASSEADVLVGANVINKKTGGKAFLDDGQLSTLGHELEGAADLDRDAIADELFQNDGWIDRDKLVFPSDMKSPTRTQRIAKRVENKPFLTAKEAQDRVDGWKAVAQQDGEKNRQANSQKTIISLFDSSGEWVKPYKDAGFNIIQFDLNLVDGHGYEMDINEAGYQSFVEDRGITDVYGILAACPCTDFSSSGARWWKGKDLNGDTEASVALVDKTLEIVRYFKPQFWVVENPVGRINKLTEVGEPLVSFQPNHLGSDYTKRTMLYGSFNTDLPTANTYPSEGSVMQNSKRGDNTQDKYDRSTTPEGLSYAFYMANGADRSIKSDAWAEPEIKPSEDRYFYKGEKYYRWNKAGHWEVQSGDAKLKPWAPVKHGETERLNKAFGVEFSATKVAHNGEAKEAPFATRGARPGEPFPTGAIIKTATGQETTPYPAPVERPKYGLTTKEQLRWGLENAIKEAESRGDEANKKVFENADIDSLKFGDEIRLRNYLFHKPSNEIVQLTGQETLEGALVDGGNVMDAVDYIANNSTNLAYKRIAKRIREHIPEGIDLMLISDGAKLRKAVPAAMKISNGMYWTKGNEKTLILKDKTFAENGMNEETVLHELIHAATIARIVEGNLNKNAGTELFSAVQDLFKLQSAVVDTLNKQKADLGVRQNLAMSDVKELVAWGLTNSESQGILSGIKYKGKNAWSAFVQAVAKLLGIKKMDHTALGELLRVTDAILDAKPIANEAETVSSQVAGATFDAAANEFRNLTFVEPQRKKLTTVFKDLGEKIRTGAIDRFDALAKLDKAKGLDPYKTPELSTWAQAKLVGASQGALAVFMKYGRIRWDADGVTLDSIKRKDGEAEGLMGVLTDLGSADEMKDFFRWIAANRAHNLIEQEAARKTKWETEEANRRTEWFNKYGNLDDFQPRTYKPKYTERLFTDEQIAAGKMFNQGTMKDGRNRTEVYDRVFEQFSQYHADVLAIAEEGGIISAEAREAWENDFYVPFFRVLDDSQENFGSVLSDGLTKQNVIKQIKGSKKPLGDLLENYIMNTHALIEGAMKNKAAKHVIETAVAVGLVERVGTHRDKTRSTYIMEDGKKVYYQFDFDETFTGEDKTAHGKKPKELSVSGKALFEAINALNPIGMNSTALNVARKFKRMFTNFTTASPAFMVRNLIRDSIQSSGMEKGGGNAVKGIKQYGVVPKISHLQARMLAGGGAFSFGHVYGDHSSEIMATVGRQIRSVPLLTGNNAAQLLKKGWENYMSVSDSLENANRASVYLANLDDGVTAANFRARDLMDFSAHGSWPAARVLIATVPFLNARIQGLDKLWRTGSHAQRYKRMMIMMGAMGVASAILHANNMDDDDYQSLPDWQRDSYWFVKLGNDDAMFIPKPFELGATATMIERFMDEAMGNPEDGALRKAFGRMLVNTFNFDPRPQIIKPAFEVYANYDSFRGRDIENFTDEGLPPSMVFNEHTTAPAKWSSSAMEAAIGEHALSPKQIDHLIRGYLGWIGTMMAGTADSIARLGDDKRVDREWWESSLVRWAYRDLNKPFYTKQQNMFYEALQQHRLHYNAYRELVKRGEAQQAKEYMEEHRDFIIRHRALDKVQRYLSSLGRQEKLIQNNRSLSPKERRRMLDAIKIKKADTALFVTSSN